MEQYYRYRLLLEMICLGLSATLFVGIAIITIYEKFKKFRRRFKK